MNIAHIIPGDLWAGAESQVYYTLKELKEKSNHNLTVILFNKGELYNRLLSENISSIIFDENLHNSFMILWYITNFLLNEKPAIVHVHEYKSHILATIAKYLSISNCKIIRTIHGRTSVPFSIEFMRSYIILRIEKPFLHYLTPHIVAVSKDLERSFRRDYKKTTIHHINNGIDINGNSLSPPEEIRRGFNIASNTLWIGTAIRLISVKNVEMLIEAANSIEKEHNEIDCRISIFGDGELKEKIEQKIYLYGLEKKVFLHGHHQNILPIMNAFDIFVLTSKNEGLPMSLLEAMSVGTIPVCTRVGGMQEVIEHGKSGFLVEPNNPKELAKTLVDIYYNRGTMDDIRNASIKRIKQHYSIEKNVKKLLNVYESL